MRTPPNEQDFFAPKTNTANLFAQGFSAGLPDYEKSCAFVAEEKEKERIKL